MEGDKEEGWRENCDPTVPTTPVFLPLPGREHFGRCRGQQHPILYWLCQGSRRYLSSWAEIWHEKAERCSSMERDLPRIRSILDL